MKSNTIDFAEYRAHALLIVQLTSRNDILFEEVNQDYGIDFLVRIVKNKMLTQRIFGIQLKAIVKVEGDLQKRLNQLMPQMESLKEVPFPLALFVFVMDNDRGYYRWLIEPSISPPGGPELRRDDDVLFTELTDETFDKLIRTVDQWYDARQRQ